MKHRLDLRERNGFDFGKSQVLRMRLVLLSVSREVWGPEMCTPHHFPTCYALSYVASGQLTLHSQGQTHAIGDSMLLVQGPGLPPHELTAARPSEIYTVLFTGAAAARFHAQLPPGGPVLRIPNSGSVYALFRALLATAEERELLYEELCRKYLEAMLLTVQSGVMRAHPRYDRVREHVVRLKQYIDRHFETLSDVSELPAHAGISQEYFTRLFKKYEGISPYRYLQNLKIHRAASLLVSTERSTAEVGAALGYLDASVFSRCFKRVMGVSPQRYRELVRSGERPIPAVGAGG